MAAERAAAAEEPRMRAQFGPAVVSVGVLLLAAGCGGGGGGDKATAAAGPSTTPEPSVAATDFVDPLSAGNKWLPLKPGTQWVREGTTLVGKRSVTHKVISTVTDVVRDVDGIQAVAVYDEERGGGELTDKSLDWLAQDSKGNIWWLGSVTEEFQAGRSNGIDEAWLAGRGKARKGLLVPADPAAHTGIWNMAKPPDEKPEVAKFNRVQPKECVPFGCYENVMVIEEGVDTSETEYKYYAAGIGQIRNEPLKSHDEDIEKLANLTPLSSDGLTEISNEVLRIDGDAVKDEPAAYSDTKATRKT